MKKELKTALLLAFTLVFSVMTTPEANAQDSWKEVRQNGEGTLTVYIQEEYPFAFYEEDELVGIEVDLLKRFVEWAKIRHGVSIQLDLKPQKEFFKVFDACRQKENVLGAASITITEARDHEVDFTAPYLKNKSVLVSPLGFNTLTSYNDFSAVFENGTAAVIRETTHERELMQIKQAHYPEMLVKYAWTTDEIHELLKSYDNYYTMIDLLTFWSWVREGERGLKVHRVATVEKEEFGFALSENSDWKEILNEFFEGGIGFAASEDYLTILNRYLTDEVIHEVK